ncbi:MAG: hypothetical protein AB1568_12850 [Thermodesulfobacteriota bacterium]
MGRLVAAICLLLLPLSGCGGGLSCMRPTGATLFRYHYGEHLRQMEMFVTRLYAKNPRYEPDTGMRRLKLRQLFHEGLAVEQRYVRKPSNEVLAAAFARETTADRVYLLGLGMVKSVREAYGPAAEDRLLIGLQLDLEKLRRLHFNLSQVNWRLKTYRDDKGELLFRANEAGEGGYINMGYEVIMTRVLTRIEDDMYLRGGLPGKYAFDLSTLFASILL